MPLESPNTTTSGVFLETVWIPQSRLQVFDRFVNPDLYGIQEFRVMLTSSPSSRETFGPGFLMCDQQDQDDQSKPDPFFKCLGSSLNCVLQFTDLHIDTIGKGYVLTIAFTEKCRQSLTDSWRTLEEIDDNVVIIGLVPPYKKWMDLGVFKAAKTMPFDVVAVWSLREVSSSLATPVGCSAYPPPTLKIIGFDDVSPLAPEKEIDFAGGAAIVFAFGCNEDSKDVVLNTGKDFQYASGTYFRQPQQINKCNSYATSLTDALAQQFAHFCPADINIGMIDGYPVMKKESGYTGYDFWRVSRRKGFCGNISDNEDSPLQTCESGIGGNRLIIEPNFISLRAECLVRNSTTASLPSMYKWTITEKDTIWFAKSVVSCKVEYSLLKGYTQITVRKGAIIFDDIKQNSVGISRYTVS